MLGALPGILADPSAELLATFVVRGPMDATKMREIPLASAAEAKVG